MTMDEVLQFCHRVLGESRLANDAAQAAGGRGAQGRVALLAAAARECRLRAEQPIPVSVPAARTQERSALAGAVAAELAGATARLPERQREALALRELLRCSYAQVAVVMAIDPAAVAPLLARARLGLREQLRGSDALAGHACPERDRTLRVLARRLDSEPISAEDDRWLPDHLAGCPACEMVHAAMLEASACYRAWP
ncbi:MAG: RNA polymerase sigma factor [Solirubrobacteraceae bacterium]